ncbi:HAD hydrolase-like protein [Arthrobacter caoxuetaonis]|uniref:HAD hydrolase-like protein n=1 Tax=Arthrobacter caoxuetaonis TaxID=2886935 RepID=A0A9X1MEZ2_9MICC|nr:HAD hydrolase-like protein [Arthrobacter caoxuetaonis]MCC3283464.1 HAD hydrolase-like protein [Arthrobacter caoxuetaonis]MCC3298863.1 HAD hydrolase-like protein [Arthrobacter caoxuetaonis]USQ55789.1 HAD hydrolase-like protein [Arthrobacter caoxuetaonis]
MKHLRLLVLFDLDGTLVDPAGSITGGISAALAASGLPVPPPADLQQMVGPALSESLTRIARVPADQLDTVIAHYRRGYRDTGMAASRPYPGIADAVRELRDAGCITAVATQKPEPLAGDLLRVQGLGHLFASVHGSPADERAVAADGKTSIIRAALERHAGEYSAAVMIGDRMHDVHGAAANGVPCIGVSWGFAAPGELAAAGAAAVVDLPGQLRDAVRSAAETAGARGAV